MSLYEGADGLLETHVTWQDVQLAMQNALETTAELGRERKATNIGDMKGFMSRIALVEPNWANTKDGEDLPQKFVVKISSQLAIVNKKTMDAALGSFWTEEKLKQMSTMTRILHNREVATYKLLAKENNPKIKITKIYASRAFDEQNELKGYIISEYIPNLVHLAAHESVPYRDCIPIIKSVAAFSAIGEKLDRETDLKFAAGSDFIVNVLGHVLNEHKIHQNNETMRKLLPREYKDQLEEMIQMYKNYYIKKEILNKYEKAAQFLGYRDVLTHNDLSGSNLLCIRENGNFHFKAIIDWQTVSFGTPVQDVGRLFVGCLNAKNRREQFDFLLELYYNSFVEELDGKPVPYTLQQLRDSYNLFFPMMTIIVISGIAQFLENAEGSEENNGNVCESAMDKMIELIEDVLQVHQSNLQRFPKFYEI